MTCSIEYQQKSHFILFLRHVDPFVKMLHIYYNTIYYTCAFIDHITFLPTNRSYRVQGCIGGNGKQH